MKFQMRRCAVCGRYTLKDLCPRCGGRTISPHPAKFSPVDKYAKYKVTPRQDETKASSQ